MEQNSTPVFAPVLIQLLQGVIYNSERESWNILLSHKMPIKNYFRTIGVDVTIFEADGFAYLSQTKVEEEEQEKKLPQLIAKRKLSYPVTLLCVLLVEKLVDSDKAGDERLILDRSSIKEMVRVFLPVETNEVKLLDRIDTSINNLIEYGFLRELDNDPEKLEVRRILKAKVDASQILEVKRKLEEHAKQY